MHANRPFESELEIRPKPKIARGLHWQAACRVLLLVLALTSTRTLAQTTHTVQLDGLQFIPADVTIRVGDTVHWIWLSGIHNVESGMIVGGFGVPDGNFRSGEPASGVTFDVMFDRAFLDAHPMADNFYPYYCVLHTFANMAGFITVVFPGDIDADADVDLADHAIQADCLSGPDSDVLAEFCSAKEFELSDIDQDGDVDLEDIAAMQLAFSG